MGPSSTHALLLLRTSSVSWSRPMDTPQPWHYIYFSFLSNSLFICFLFHICPQFCSTALLILLTWFLLLHLSSEWSNPSTLHTPRGLRKLLALPPRAMVSYTSQCLFVVLLLPGKPFLICPGYFSEMENLAHNKGAVKELWCFHNISPKSFSYPWLTNDKLYQLKSPVH